MTVSYFECFGSGMKERCGKGAQSDEISSQHSNLFQRSWKDQERTTTSILYGLLLAFVFSFKFRLYLSYPSVPQVQLQNTFFLCAVMVGRSILNNRTSFSVTAESKTGFSCLTVPGFAHKAKWCESQLGPSGKWPGPPGSLCLPQCVPITLKEGEDRDPRHLTGGKEDWHFCSSSPKYGEAAAECGGCHPPPQEAVVALTEGPCVGKPPPLMLFPTTL